MAPAAAVSLTTHAIVIGTVILLRFAPSPAPGVAHFSEQVNRGIVWLRDPGTGGGGGGGGNQSKTPPRAALVPGHDPISVPARRPERTEPSPPDVKPLQPDIPVREIGSSSVAMPGVINTLPGPPTDSQGPGSRGGAGTGTDGGIGPGRGSGLGDGTNGNTGGGPRRPGNGVSDPILVREVKPAFTSEAMRARVQGSVLVECIVNVDGSVSNARVVRSLDTAFGLDQEALKAARQWRFRPGMFHGEPVPVQITIELIFTLR